MGSIVKPHTCMHCFHDCKGNNDAPWRDIRYEKPDDMQPFVAAYFSPGYFWTPPTINLYTCAFYTSPQNGMKILTFNNGYYPQSERRLCFRPYQEQAEAYSEVSQQFTHWHPIPDFKIKENDE